VSTKVEGNKVSIDDVAYQLKPQPDGSIKVFDDYNMHIGSFTFRGRAVEAEDFGVELAHPVKQIGKLWVEAQVAAREAKPAAAALALCRIAQHEPADEASVTKASAYVAWLKKQPGVISATLAYDSAKKRAVSITVWKDQASMSALTAPPDGAAPLKASSSETIPVVA
jgi:hypothetical protein